MQRTPHKSSSQQSLVILILIVLIVVAISVNVTLAWFYNRATNSRIEVIGDIEIATQVLNGKTMDFDKDELFAGNIIERTIRIQKDSYAPNFYLRVKSEVRIDGITTNLFPFSVAEVDSEIWLPESSDNVTWYYCYTDFDALDSLTERSPNIHIEYQIPLDISAERLERVITVIFYMEIVAVDGDISSWQNLPENWPFVVEIL